MKKDMLKPPLAGLVYGEIIYWGVMAGSVLVMLGSVLAFVTRHNFVPVSHWMSAVWQGESVGQIWKSVVPALPPGHWYLSHLTTGDGLTAFGISISVFSVVPALFASAATLFWKREKLYGALALTAGIIVVIAMLGLIPTGA